MTINKLKYSFFVAAFILGTTPFITSSALTSHIFLNDPTSIPLAEDSTTVDNDDDADSQQADDENDEEETDSIDEAGDDEEMIIKDSEGKEQIIEVPEGLTADIDEMLDEYNAQAYLKQDTTCHMKNENPTFDKEVYQDRLKRMPTAMEMPWNEIVQKFIDRYSGKLRRSVSYMLGASNFYMPTFEDALEVYGIPLELKYLPVIESALNPNATSRVGAGGLWQFMVASGKRYGLRVNSMIDERRDPVKSSYAAAHYLSDLYHIFGDWNLVLAAYNAGPGNVKKAIERAGGEKDYWKIYKYLPSETRGYVPAFIAANYIMTYYCDHNICPMLTTLPVQTDTIMLYRNVHFQQISHVLGIDIKELRALNPQYRRDVVTGYTEPTDLRLPLDYIDKFIANEDSIFAYNTDELMKRDVVEVDENAGAYRSRSYSRSSRSSNNNSWYSKKSKKKKKKSRDSGSKSVSIKEGDTLSEIAHRNHTTVAKLKKLNGITGSNIRAGKKLKVK